MTLDPAPAPSLPVVDHAPDHPWNAWDAWIGLAIFIVMTVSVSIILARWTDDLFAETVGILIGQALLLLPILFALARRKATLTVLGYRNFRVLYMGIGCALFPFSFVINLINNLIFTALKMSIQAEDFSGLLKTSGTPVWLLIGGILMAPFLEETFFRGLLFAGFSKSYGPVWGALISSALFGAAHLSIPAFVPTFMLGLLFCFLYYQSKSILIGVTLHMLLNSLSLCALIIFTQAGYV